MSAGGCAAGCLHVMRVVYAGCASSTTRGVASRVSMLRALLARGSRDRLEMATPEHTLTARYVARVREYRHVYGRPIYRTLLHNATRKDDHNPRLYIPGVRTLGAASPAGSAALEKTLPKILAG